MVKMKYIQFIIIIFVLAIACIAFQSLSIKAATPVSLKGTDIYNGLRGQNFNEGWKFNKGDVSGGQNSNYNDSSWANVTLPHDWSIFNTFNQNSASGSGGGYLDGGTGWYRKTFNIPADYNGKKVYINFDGAYMNSQVWINGNLLGTRPYGYVSFEYDLTPYLVYGGSNAIAVKINNNQPNSRWYSGSGLYRNVWLTVLNQTHVDYCGVSITTTNVSNSSSIVNIKAKIMNKSNEAKPVTLKTTILDANENTITTDTSSATNINASSNSTINQNLTVSNPQLWSTNSPYLYIAQTELIIDGKVVDKYKSTFGIRYFNFDANNGFSLNGVNMKINGVCLHHDLGALGAAVNYRAIERELEIMKDMGCNAIRTSHNPADPQLLEICDRLGLLVMEEAFDCWETGINSNDYHLYFNSWAQADIKSMVTRDRNHPSIIMWSLGNEIPNATVTTVKNLKNWVKEIDTTRPVTCGSNEYYNGLSTEILSTLDLVGYNYVPGIYDSRHKEHPEWKIFGSETSSAVRSRGIYKTPTNQNILSSSDMQCSSYDNSVVSWGNSAESSYTAINNRKFMAGEFIWTGFDYIGEPTPYGWPAKSSYFGIVDTCGFPKDIYYFYQSKWTTKPMVHILPHWNWSNGTNVEVWAYSNCDTVELFLNGVSQGVKNVGSSLHLSWNIPWKEGTLQAKATKGGVVVYDQVITSGSAAKVQLKPDRKSITADGKDLVYIEVNITDANGVIVPTASNKVDFSVSGPGTIVGVDNGNAISTELYKSNSRKAYNGKCLVIVQASKSTGTIKVTANSNGLSEGITTIDTIEGEAQPVDPTTTTIVIPSITTSLNTTAIPTTTSGSSYVRFSNVATGLYIDGMGSTSNGSNACQWSDSNSSNQQWKIFNSGEYILIQNAATGLYLDGMGRTSNGSICGQWSSSGSTNQQWIQEIYGNNVRLKNRATGLYLDSMGSTSNGSNLCQWSNSGSTNQQWQVK